MSEVNDEVNNDEVDNENSQVLEIMPPRNNEKVEGEEEEEPGKQDLTLSGSLEKKSESAALNEITEEKVSSIQLSHGNDPNNSTKQYVEGLEDKAAEQDSKNSQKVEDSTPSKTKTFKCCPEGFCELVARRKHRTDKLMKRQAEISTRLATLEAWLPMVTFNKIIQSECDPRNVIKCIEEQATIMSSATKRSVLRHETQEIGGLGAERKEALRRHDEARRVLHEKQLQLKKLNEQIENARRKQEELQLKIYETEIKNEVGEGGIYESESEYSFGPGDLENLTRLEELIIGERKVKKDLKELERREAAYVEILKSADFWKAKKDPGACLDGDVDKLRGQLAAKSSANQQLAGRICQLEDQIENLERKLRNCNHKIIEFSEKQEEDNPAKLRERTNGARGDSAISVRDKATLARVTTTDRSSGGRSGRKVRSRVDGNITEEKSVNAVVGTSSKTTHTRIEVTDRAVQDPIPRNEKSIGNKRMSIEETSESSEESKKDGKLQEGETGEETVERITTFDEAQTSGRTLLSRAGNESSPVGADSSWNNGKTFGDNAPGLDDNQPREMDTGSRKRLRSSSQSYRSEKLEVMSRNPESLLDDSTASKADHLDLSALPGLEDHKTDDVGDQSTQYEVELPFGGPKNVSHHSINDQDVLYRFGADSRSGSGDKSFVSMKSRLSKEETNYDVSEVPDDIYPSRDQSKHSSVRLEDGEKKSLERSYERSAPDDKSFVSLKSQLSKEETNYDVSGVPDEVDVRSPGQSKHSSVRFEDEEMKSLGRSNERSAPDDKSFVSMKSRLSKEETNYDVSEVPDDIYPSHDQSKHSSVRLEDGETKSLGRSYERSAPDDKSFVSLKSQLSKEETNYDVSGVPDEVDVRSPGQSKHSSVRFEDTHRSGEGSSSSKSFRSMKSQLSKELTNYEFSGVENEVPEAGGINDRSSGKSFVSLKSQLSKEETDYGFEEATSEQELPAIVVQRNELKLWLKNLSATHSAISKCRECVIKKPEVIEIIEAIRGHLGIGSTKTTDQPNQMQIRRADYDQNQDFEDGKRSLIKKRGTKPRSLELRQQQTIGEEEEMRMIKEHIGLPSGTSTPIDKESKQTVRDNDGIDPARSIQHSVSRQASSDVRGEYREPVRSELINERSIGGEANTSGRNNVSSRVQIQDQDKSGDKHFKTITDTITRVTMDKVDVGTLAAPSLVGESQSHEPDAPLLLNENTNRQKHQSRDETDNSGAASIVLSSTVGITPEPQSITTTTTATATATATSSGAVAPGNTATASTSTSNLSRRGEGKARSKGHEATAYSMPQGEIFKDVRQPGGRYGTKMNSSESTRALSTRMEDVNREIDESRAWRDGDRARREDLREIRDTGDEDPGRLPRKGMKIYENKATPIREFDGLSDTEDREKVMRNFSDNRPITASQAQPFGKKSSSDCPELCCICHRKQQGKKLTKSQYEELVARAGLTRVCLIESTSEFSDQQTQPSHKTKPSKSSPRKLEAAVQVERLRLQKPKGYPDFSCEVCDCDPCGSNKSKSGRSSPRSDNSTRSRPRSTARSRR